MAKKKTSKKLSTKKTAKKVATKPAKKTPKKAATKPAKKTAKKVATKSAKKTSANASKITTSVNLNSEKNSQRKNEPINTTSSVIFSLEDVEALVANKKEDQTGKKSAKDKKLTTNKGNKQKAQLVKPKQIKAQKHSAASIADILGFNPIKKESATILSEQEIPNKWKRYYKLLIELRKHVKDELDLHTAETLKQSSKDNSGDLSGYGSHQADAGTDTFDRDFALGILSNEHDALNEIEEAIYRIKNGNYGICEETGKPIKKERLTAVPFTRYSLEGQIEFEKNSKKRRERIQSGLFEDNSDSLNLGPVGDDE